MLAKSGSARLKVKARSKSVFRVNNLLLSLRGVCFAFIRRESLCKLHICIENIENSLIRFNHILCASL